MGTWTLPQTQSQAKALQALLQQPLPAGMAENLLYPLFGDDDLFETITLTEKLQGPDADVRVSVKTMLAGELVRRTAVKPWDPEAYRLLYAECKDYIPVADLLCRTYTPYESKRWVREDVLPIRPDLTLEQAATVIDAVRQEPPAFEDMTPEYLEAIVSEHFAKVQD